MLSVENKHLQETSWELAGWITEQGLKQISGEPIDPYFLEILRGFRKLKTGEQHLLIKKVVQTSVKSNDQPIQKGVDVLQFVPPSTQQVVKETGLAAVKRSASSMELELVKVKGRSNNRFEFLPKREPDTIRVLADDSYVDKFDHLVPGKKYTVTGLAKSSDYEDLDKYSIRAGTSFTLIEPF